MIQLIHGDNQQKSFEKLLELKSIFQGEIIEYSPEQNLGEVLAETSLFSKNKLIQIDNPTKCLTNFEPIEIPPETSVVLYESKQLSKSELTKLSKLFPDLQVEEFKLDQVVFKFVESIAPSNQKIMIPLYRQYASNEQPEIAMVMIARQIRLMLGGEGVEKLPSWQQQKISSQSKKFSEQQLTNLLNKLLEVDYKNKTGQTPLDLSLSLELLLMSI